MGLRYRAGVCALALVAGSAALQFEPTVIRNLVVDNGGHRISVGAVKVPLWSAAFAQSADSFALENVSFSFGGARYEAKRIEVSGSASSRADIEALFSSSASEPLAGRLARVSAKKIVLPEVKLTQQSNGRTVTVTYSNVTLSDIVKGKIASTTVEAMAMDEKGPEVDLVGSFGRAAISDFDLPAFARLYETKAASTSDPMALIHGQFSIEKTELRAAKEQVGFKIARISGRDFMARPTLDSWTGTSALLERLGNKADLSDAEQKQLMTSIADLLGAFNIASAEAAGIEFAVPKKDKSKQPSAAGRIERIAYTGAIGSAAASVRMEGFAVSDQDMHIKFGGISLTGFSFESTLNGLKTLQDKSLDDLDQADMRPLIPTLGTLRVSDVDIDGPSDEEGGKPGRIVITMKGLELTADKPLNGFPTNVRFETRDVAMKLPSGGSDELIAGLLGPGSEKLTSSFLLDASWNESTNEILLKQVAGEAKGMGRFSLTGVIGSANKDLFSTDEATAAAALIAMKAKSASLVVEDNGLFDRYLAETAKKQKTKPDTLRKLYADAAPLVLTSMAGSSEQTSTLARAIASFIAKPGKLMIEATSKSPSGFGFMDVALAAKPADAIQKLNITAKVE
ncbi:hypothetical protein [Microvirga mediterraneensis]|uniref:DUF748 domain-containing protein n=1 Tax=Microvirga mediterraneensis TaxID=2754695 RepID=A0A838BNW3_9HYPH|nr:hypothetical protein [Microvirga mediterraneensis]MBA1156759.1 hypothetical protein [Microvirga mediterraneensis]